jgi:LuxR family maltose regulon positive regulatory protein
VPTWGAISVGGIVAAWGYDCSVVDGSGAMVTSSVVVIERESLLIRLRTNSAVPVVVVHAGAGFGKTTLASQWAREDPRPHVVVRIARFLDDPAALALRLIDAFEVLGPTTGATREVVSGSEPAFSAVLLPAMTSLMASRGEAFVLVLDDIQLLSRPECHELLAAVVEGIPAGSQVAFLSRLEPPSWLARTRAAGRLLELGPGDLAFDDLESRQLLGRLGADLPDELISDLVVRAEGWPVGLYLMALALRSSEGQERPGTSTAKHRATSVPASGSERYVVDYLRAEVLGGLPQRSRDFLRRTAILDELDAPLCDAVLGRHDSAAVLFGLSHQLQFVVPLEPGGRAFRCHHLLADALRADLEGQEPWLMPDLHLRASAWYEDHGDADAAIRHAKAAGDSDRTGTLVWAGVPGCISTGRPDRLAAWLGDLEDVQIRSNRWLTLAAAWLGLQTGDADRMTRWLLAAEEHAGPGWEAQIAEDVFAACLACIHVLVGDGGLEHTIDLCRGAQLGLPRDSEFRSAAFHDEGVALTLTRKFPEGLASLQQAERVGRALGVPIIEANALAWQGMLALLADDWAHGAPLIARAGDLVHRHHLDRLATSANSITALALLQAARGSKDEARVTLGNARRLTNQVAQIAPWFAVAGRLVQARVAILLGDGGLARTLCSEAKDHMSPDLADTLLADLLVDTEARLLTLHSEGGSPTALTAAELRVLQFLPSRLTFAQIGEHLFLSQTTIKSQAQSIYRKLGASSRDEAIARAQALGLVEFPPLA